MALEARRAVQVRCSTFMVLMQRESSDDSVGITVTIDARIDTHDYNIAFISFQLPSAVSSFLSPK